MMATLTIERSSEYVNRLRKIGVYLDGQKIDTIRNGETKDYPLTPGTHVLKTKIDWCGSRELELNVADDEARTVKLSGFMYSRYVMPAMGVIFGINLLFVYVFNIVWFTFLLVPFALIMCYYVTVGRNNYLTLRED